MTEKICKRVIPEHIAIIMDGNGRWAKKRGLARPAGHAAGSETFRRIATCCAEIGVKYLTVYAFSTENWKRPAEEIGAIMGLLKKYLLEAVGKLKEDDIGLYFFGDRTRLDAEILDLIAKTDAITKTTGGLKVGICLNYGGRDEIVRAARNLAEKAAKGLLAPDAIDGAVFAKELYTNGFPDPDLVIRPSGEIRISNFLLWQSAYAELYFTDTLWPDFDREELLRAIESFSCRSRRYGGVDNK